MAVFRRWLIVLRIPLALLAVVLFFVFYNRFLLDVNLQNLESSLSVLDAATGVGQAEAALLLVDQTLVATMAQEEMDVKTLASLQYALGALSSGQLERSVEDAQVMVATIAEQQATARPGLLSTLDAFAGGVQGVFRTAAFLPRRLTAGAVSYEIDAEGLQQAIRRERLGLFREAADRYEELLKLYPTYVGKAAIKLRLGYLYQRIRLLDQAERLYREVAKETRDQKQADAAYGMLKQLSQFKAKERQVPSMEQRLASLGAGPERQRLAFQLGGLLVQLYQMEKAAQTFHEAALADPEGELALQSIFKQGWCLKSLGRLEEAFAIFQEVTRRDPKGPLAASADHQIAEVYKATGDYEGAVQVYERLIAQTPDKALVALVLAQAGSTYLFDLKDPEKAASYFQDLSLRIPASPFSATGQKIQQLQAGKLPLEPAAVEKLPLLPWLETSLPVFVEVFAQRLSRYIESVGEKDLTRRYTEQEFREQVLRRVKERFPGQISNVTMKIRPEGYIGSATIRLGMLSFPVEGTAGIVLVKERPHVILHELKVGPVGVPEGIRKLLEMRVNQTIDRLRLPLKVKRYELRDGYAWVSVELVD